MRTTDAELAGRAAAIFAELRDLVLSEETARQAARKVKVRPQVRIASYAEQERVIGAIPSLSDEARARAESTLLRLKSAWWALAMTCAGEARKAGRRGPDLEHVAMIGLYEAARRFDPSHGVLFYTFARHWARTYVDREAFRDTVVKRPDALFALRFQAARLARDGMSRNEIWKAIGCDPDMALATDRSLDAPAPRGDGEDGGNWLDALPAPADVDPTVSLDFDRALHALPESDRAHADRIIAGETLGQIAEAVGISKAGAQLREQRVLQSIGEWANPEVMKAWPVPIGALVVAISEGVGSRHWLAYRIGCRTSTLPAFIEHGIEIGALRHDEKGRLVPA